MFLTSVGWVLKKNLKKRVPREVYRVVLGVGWLNWLPLDWLNTVTGINIINVGQDDEGFFEGVSS